MPFKRRGAARLWPARLGWGLLLAGLLALALLRGLGAAWALFFGLILLALASGGLLYLAAPAVSATLEADATGHKNKPACGRLLLHNAGRLPLAQLRCTLLAGAPGGEAAQRLTLSAALPPRGATAVAFSLQSPWCGALTLRAETLELVGWLGLFRRRVPCAAEARITILPNTFAAHVTLLESGMALLEGESYAAAKPGHDRSEPLWLREYAPGDSQKDIHWKLSGKLNRLVVRVPSLPVQNKLLLLFDPAPGAPPEVFDALAEALFSLSQALADAGVPHEAGWMEEGRLRREAIASLDDLLALLTRTLACRRAPGSASPAEALLAQEAPERFSQLLYLCSAPPAGLGALPGAVTLLHCGEAPAAGGGVTVLHFTPQTVQDALAHLVV